MQSGDSVISVIPSDEAVLIWAVVVALAGFGFWAENNTRFGRALTGIIVAMMSAMLLSNLKILPFQSAVYDSIFEHFLPLAIPLMLFRADVIEAIRTGGKTIIAFALGAVGILVGVLVAGALIPLGDLTAVTAGMLTATYTGGSANFAAVAIAADFSDGTVITSMVAADIVATNLQTMLLVALPGIAAVRRYFPEPVSDVSRPDTARQVPETNRPPTNLAGAAFALSMALLLVYLGSKMAEWVGKPTLGIVITTLLALIVGNFMKPLVRQMAHDFEIGLVFIFLFLVALAAGADVSMMMQTGLPFFAFAMLMLSVHTVFLLACGKLLKFDLRSLVIGSTACVGGVTSATAIASAKGWRNLIIPGIMAGTLGNAVGTLLGVGVWMLY